MIPPFVLVCAFQLDRAAMQMAAGDDSWSAYDGIGDEPLPAEVARPVPTDSLVREQ